MANYMLSLFVRNLLIAYFEWKPDPSTPKLLQSTQKLNVEQQCHETNWLTETPLPKRLQNMSYIEFSANPWSLTEFKVHHNF